MSSAINTECKAAVQEFRATAHLVPTVSANFLSNASTFFPEVSHPEMSTSLMPERITSKSSFENDGLENGTFVISWELDLMFSFVSTDFEKGALITPPLPFRRYPSTS